MHAWRGQPKSRCCIYPKDSARINKVINIVMGGVRSMPTLLPHCAKVLHKWSLGERHQKCLYRQNRTAVANQDEPILINALDLFYCGEYFYVQIELNPYNFKLRFELNGHNMCNLQVRRIA